MLLRSAALVATVGAAAASAQEIEFAIPVECELGRDCYIQSVVDRDPGPGATDFTCGSLTYDGHKGVDFRVATMAEMRAGVNILAAAAGVVRAIRDGESDGGVAAMTEGRDCGNGVVVDHGGGWTSQYCHLARSSLVVSSGDRVEAGDKIGLMGLSGRTEFPHLHLAIRKDGVVIDPFDSRPSSESCELADDADLWLGDDVEAKPGGVVDGGFVDNRPTLAAVRNGDLSRAPFAQDGAALIFWSRYFGLRDGDEMRLSITAPDGSVLVEKSEPMNRARAEHMIFIGKRTPADGWAPGVYGGEAALIRNGVARETKAFSLTIAD